MPDTPKKRPRCKIFNKDCNLKQLLLLFNKIVSGVLKSASVQRRGTDPNIQSSHTLLN